MLFGFLRLLQVFCFTVFLSHNLVCAGSAWLSLGCRIDMLCVG